MTLPFGITKYPSPSKTSVQQVIITARVPTLPSDKVSRWRPRVNFPSYYTTPPYLYGRFRRGALLLIHNGHGSFNGNPKQTRGRRLRLDETREPTQDCHVNGFTNVIIACRVTVSHVYGSQHMLPRATTVFVIGIAIATSVYATVRRGGEPTGVCTPTLDDANHEKLRTAGSRSLLLNSFNDVLGTKTFLAYNDSAVTASLRRVHVGGLRHPGGTVANYWSLVNASYIVPCKGPGGIKPYDECGYAKNVSRFAPNTFTAANFVSQLVPNLQPFTAADEELRVVFDLNILTLSEEETVNQVDYLVASIPNASTRIKYVELGNEYYLKHYNYWFANASVYMEKATPVIARVRKLLPNAKIAAVTRHNSVRNGSGVEFNDQVAKFKDLIDAVTIHDYTSQWAKDEHAPTKNEKWERLILHGPKIIPVYAEGVRTLFGADKQIWMTSSTLVLPPTSRRALRSVGSSLSSTI
jgi:hypothetical protein